MQAQRANVIGRMLRLVSLQPAGSVDKIASIRLNGGEKQHSSGTEPARDFIAAIGLRHFSSSSERTVDRAQRQGRMPFLNRPGVYIFRNSDEQPIYVGKAKSLNRRLRSYFYKSVRSDIKLSHLLASARSVETIVTNTEGEALNLENRLIKQMRPRYNVLLRDDKTYPYIKLAATGPGAEVTITRRRQADDAIYYGPFFPASLAHQIARLIRRYFLATRQAPLVMDCAIGRSIRRRKEKLKTGPNRVLRHETKKVRKIRRLLEGHIDDVVTDFSHQAALASDAPRFEEAARYWHYIGALKQLREQLNAASIPDDDTDIIGFCSSGPRTAFTILQFRSGEIAGRYDVIAKSFGGSGCDELLPSLLHSLYSESSAPLDIVTPVCRRQRKIVEQALSSVGRRGVRIRAPAAGPFRAWEDIANRNAQASLEEWTHGSGRQNSPARHRNEAHYRLSEVYPRRWQSVGPAGGCYHNHGSARRAAHSGPGQWRPFVAVRHSGYVSLIRSGFAPPRNMLSSDVSSPRTKNGTTFRPEPTELSRVTIKLPDRGAMAQGSSTEPLIAWNSLTNQEKQ